MFTWVRTVGFGFRLAVWGGFSGLGVLLVSGCGCFGGLWFAGFGDFLWG